MQQKTIWIIFMIIGVIETCLISCKKIIEPVQNATYVYVNKLSYPILFKLFNSDRNIAWEAKIASGDSLVYIIKGDIGAFPFSESESENRTGDLVTISFENGKCTKYIKDLSPGNYEGTGVFNLKNYNNYTKELVSRKKYRLSYHISDKDLKIAENCN